MSDDFDPPEGLRDLTRREVLKSVGKYSSLAAGATVVAISANEALAQAAASNWKCRDHYPWWLCWFLGYQDTRQVPEYGGWQDFPENRNLPDQWEKTYD